MDTYVSISSKLLLFDLTISQLAPARECRPIVRYSEMRPNENVIISLGREKETREIITRT